MDIEKFKDWEIMPEEITKQIDITLENKVKASIFEAVKDMDICSNIGSEHTNARFLGWLEKLIEKTKFDIRFKEGLPHLAFNVLDFDIDPNEEFLKSVNIMDFAYDVADFYGDNTKADSDDRILIAHKLREAADIIEKGGE